MSGRKGKQTPKKASSASKVELDVDGSGSGYSGTFRWNNNKVLTGMPSVHEALPFEDYGGGWMSYLMNRHRNTNACAMLIKSIQGDLSRIDCLSSPVTIASMCSRVGLIAGTKECKVPVLNIVCIGCSAKAEERILRETNCFDELRLGFRNVQRIELWLIGPEMSATKSNVPQGKGPSDPSAVAVDSDDEDQSDQGNEALPQLNCHIFAGTSMQFFRANPSLMLGTQTVVVGLNCGFGNFDNPGPKKYDLLLSWLPDLMFLTGTKLPLFFTCANDYADLGGEVAVMQSICGASFIAEPEENGFGYASTLVSDEKKRDTEGSDYSRGNAFWYAVQGHDKSRRQKINDTDDKVLQVLTILSKSKQVVCSQLMKPAIRIGESSQQPSTNNEALSTASANVPTDRPPVVDSIPEDLTVNEVDTSAVDLATNQVDAALTLDSIDDGSGDNFDANMASNSRVLSAHVPPLSEEIRPPLIEAEPPLTINQTLDSNSNQLTITFLFSNEVLCESMNNFDLQVSSSGQSIILQYKIVRASNYQSCTETIALVAPTASSGTARFSKTKRRLIYNASLV